MKKFFDNLSFDNGLDIFVGLFFMIISIVLGIGFYFNGLFTYLVFGHFPLYCVIISSFVVSLYMFLRGLILGIKENNNK